MSFCTVTLPFVNYLQIRFYISVRLMGHRLAEAALTRPTWQDWLLALQLLVIFGLIVVPVGLASGLITFTPTGLVWQAKLFIILRALLFPAILEEGFWRVLLLPHRSERMSDRKRWLLGLPMLAMFVLVHPLNGMTVYTAAFDTFTDPIFLLSSALLGFICMVAYWRSGSWWVPAVIHWLVVLTWLLVFGGYAKLHN